MFTRLSNGWQLATQSFRVLKLDKELLVFPLLSGLACLAVLASFAAPLWNSEYAGMLLNDQKAPDDPLAYLLLFTFYFVNYFVIVFFNSALVACAVIRFKGGDPTVGDGLRAASGRFPQIVAWALVSATVGMILKLIESKSEKVGQIVAGLLGMGWAVTTYFVVPVLVVEGVGPVKAVKRSLSILRRTWGEALGGNFGIGLITFLLCLPGILLVVLSAVAFVAGNVVLGCVVAGLGIAIILLVSLVGSAMDAILLAALYIYAAEEKLPQYFDGDLLEHAFREK